jgi:SpoVK/Ycf46/Vps4 family AAA+-type ATPase
MPIHEDLALSLDILRPLTYVVTEEEDRVIEDIYKKTLNDDGHSDSDIKIYRSTIGLRDYKDYKKESEDADQPIAKPDASPMSNVMINNTLNEIFQAKSIDKRLIYVLLDIDNFLIEGGSNYQVIRRLKDIVLSCYRDQVNIKTLVIVSSDLIIPRKLQRYIEVLYYNLPNDAEIKEKTEKILLDYNSTITDKNTQIQSEVPPSMVLNLKALTTFEIEQITLSSIKKYGHLDPNSIKGYKKSVLRKTHLLEMMDTNYTINDVGGMSHLKEWLDKREGVWTDEAIKDNVPMLKGVLLLGITGCGKSLLGKAVANHWNLPLIHFDTSKIFSSRVGESESNMMKALKIVESISPCVLLVDEIEKAFAGSQSSTFSDAGTTSRVIGSFLTWFQESTAPVFVVATSNGIQYLPPELISRFDDKFFVNVPSFSERQAIWEIILRRYGRDWKTLKLNMTELATRTKTFTGREIEQVIKAGIYEWHWEKRKSGKADLKLEQKHFLTAIQQKVPVLETMKEEITYLYQWVGWDETKKNGVRAIYANAKDEEATDDIDTLLTEALKSDSLLDKYGNRKIGRAHV